VFTGNAATGGSGNGSAKGLGGAIGNLNGSVTLDSVIYSGNTATNSDATIGSGAMVYNLSHDGGNTAAGKTSSALLRSSVAGVCDCRKRRWSETAITGL